MWWRVQAAVRGQVMDPAADKPIHFSSIFFPPRRVFGAKRSAKRVHISNAKQGQAISKVLKDFQKNHKSQNVQISRCTVRHTVRHTVNSVSAARHSVSAASEWVGQRVGEALSDDGCSGKAEAESAYGKD
jgi:hypothetical protein